MIHSSIGHRKRGQAPVREGFHAKFSLEDTNAAAGTFSGYASVFNSEVDTWPRTIVDRGAFSKTLAESRSRVRILYAHDPAQVIGKPLEMYEDSRGLYLKAEIARTQLGQDVMELLRQGMLDELSVGFDPIRWDMMPDPADPTQQIRHLKEIRLWEISVVAFAADPRAIIEMVHARRGGRDLVAELQTQHAAFARAQITRQLIELELNALALGVTPGR